MILVQLRLICKTDNVGYVVNDEVVINPAGNDPGAADSRGISVILGSTNINIRYGSASNALTIINKTTGAAALITNANWRLVIRAWV